MLLIASCCVEPDGRRRQTQELHRFLLSHISYLSRPRRHGRKLPSGASGCWHQAASGAL